MANAINQVQPQANTVNQAQPQANMGGPGVIDTALNMMNVMNMPAQIEKVKAQTHGVKNDFKTAVQNNQYHDKLASDNEDKDKKEKAKEYLAKATPAIIGATLLTAYGVRAAKTGDWKQPGRDVADGAKRIPAAIFNKVKAIKAAGNAYKAVNKGIQDGAIKAVKAGGAKAKINNSFLSNWALGTARGLGYVGPFILGANYLEHKAKKAEGKAHEQNLNEMASHYQGQAPTPVVLAKTGKAIADVVKQQQQEKTAGTKDNAVNLGKKILDYAKTDGKKVIKDAVRDNGYKALVTFGSALAGAELIRRAQRQAKNDIADMIEGKRFDKSKQNNDKGVNKEAAEKLAGKPIGVKYGEDVVKDLVRAGMTAAATLPAAVAFELYDRRKKRKHQEKEDNRRRIERKYNYLQSNQKRENKYGGNKYNDFNSRGGNATQNS